MALGAIALSTLGQLGFQEADRRRAQGRENAENETFKRGLQELQGFKYTDPQGYADQVAEAEKIAGAATKAGDLAIRSGIQQNIAAASADPRMAPQAASAVQTGGEAAFNNMMRAAQMTMPYRQRLADTMAQTQRMNEQHQLNVNNLRMQRAANAAEAARQEKRIAQQEMGNALLTGVSQGIDFMGAKNALDAQMKMASDQNDLMRDLYGNRGGNKSETENVVVAGDVDLSDPFNAQFGEDMDPNSYNFFGNYSTEAPPEPTQRDYSSDANLQYTMNRDGQIASTAPGSALQDNTSFSSPFSVPDMRTRTRFSNFEMPEAPDLSTSIGGFPAPDPLTVRGLPSPNEPGGTNYIDPSGVEYYNPGQSPAGRMMDMLGGYGNYGQMNRDMQIGPPDPLQPPLPYSGGPGIQMPFGPIRRQSMLARGEEGMSLPMMTPGEPSHETNEQRLIDKDTGAPIADLMGAETVLNDKQTAQIEKDLKEGDEKGLFRFMKKLFNKPQFKNQRAQNGNYKGRKDIPGGMADPRMAMMQAMMQGR